MLKLCPHRSCYIQGVRPYRCPRANFYTASRRYILLITKNVNWPDQWRSKIFSLQSWPKILFPIFRKCQTAQASPEHIFDCLSVGSQTDALMLSMDTIKHYDFLDLIESAGILGISINNNKCFIRGKGLF